MAMLVSIFCRTCKKSKQVIAGSGLRPTICSECKAKKSNQDEKAHFARLDSMTIKDRVREIEVWMYEHSDQKHYSPPMKF